MKKSILFILSLFCLLGYTRSQDSLDTQLHVSSLEYVKGHKPAKNTKEYFELKAVKFKTAGELLLGAGVVVGVIGVIVYNEQIKKEYTLYQVDEAVVNTGLSELVIVAGVAMVATSIPMFIVSGHFNRKAKQMTAALKLEPYPQINMTSMTIGRYPALSLVIRL